MQNNYFSVEEEKMISEEECFETDNEKTIEGDNGEPSVVENVVKSDVFDVIKKHFDKFWLYYALPVIICALFFAVLKASNIYPFSHNCISSYDLLAQICPFLEHFYDVFDGKSSLTYSTAIMGGADVFGTLAYCAISPFTFVFLLFGKGNVYYAASFVMPLKLSCIALSSAYFLRKYFKNIPEVIVLVLSLLYAYSGYMFVANTYINWLDFLIYMPFVISGFMRLVKERKIRYFAIFYALMIYTCFSIACFALLIVFLILVCYAVIVPERAERADVLAKTCFSLVVAVGLSLPLMVPAFFAYVRSGRNTGIFENLWNDLSYQHLYSKLTYIVADTAFVALSLIYFFKNGVKESLDKFLAVTGILLFVPIFIDESCNLLNAGSYMSYSLRFGFLTTPYGLYISARLLNGLDFSAESEKESDKSLLGKYAKNKIASVCFFALAFLATAFFIVFGAKILNGEDVYNTLKDGEKNNFASVFAHSVGGVEYIAPLALAVAIVIFVGAVLYKKKLLDFKKLSCAVVVLLSVQVAFYNMFLVAGNAFNPVRYDQYNAIVKKINETYEPNGKGYYRIKDYNDALTNDAAFSTHTNCFSVFSSVIDRDNFKAPLFFNYDGNKVNCMKSSGGLFFGDCLLGYKYYYIHNDGNYHSSQSRSYNKLLEDTQQQYFAAVENTICFPNAYTVNSSDLVFDGTNYENLGKLYKFLGGEGELFDKMYAVSESDIAFEASTGIYTISLPVSRASGNAEGQWYFYNNFPEDYDIKYMVGGFDEDGATKLTKDAVDLGYKKSGSSTVCIKSYNKSLDKSIIAKYCSSINLSLNKIRKLSASLDERAVDYNIDRDTFTATVTAETDGEYLFMNYVAIKGFKATVNGKKAELIDNGLSFMLVKLEKGENQIKIEYSSPYLKYILIGVALAALVLFAVYLVLKKFPVAYEKMKTPVCVAALVLAIGVFAFFFIYPTSVFLVKLVKLVIGLF